MVVLFALARHALLPLILLTIATPSAANPITATLEGCVAVTDPRLADALWSASGTFQAVAFDDPVAGCEATIAHPVDDAFHFDENRIDNTLKAWLNLANLPTCGRRQYDLHHYLAFDVLDPMGLKSLVIDTGIDCATTSRRSTDSTSNTASHVPEPSTVALVATALGSLMLRRMARSGPGL